MVKEHREQMNVEQGVRLEHKMEELPMKLRIFCTKYNHTNAAD